MVIYVDVLLFVNFVIDYLILRLEAKIIKINYKLWRLVIGAISSSVFSLYIFLPKQSLIIDVLIKILCSAVTVFIAFGFCDLKYYFRNIGVFFAVSYLFAGIIFGLQTIRPNSNINVYNGVVYFNISPVLLLLMSFIIYLLIAILKKVFNKTAETADRLNLSLKFHGISITAVAIIDTGHSLCDIFGDNLMIIIDKKLALKLFGTTDVEMMLQLLPPISEKLSTCFRLIPAKTVSGDKILPGVKIDSITVLETNTKYKNPIAVISDSDLGDDFSVIMPSI